MDISFGITRYEWHLSNLVRLRVIGNFAVYHWSIVIGPSQKPWMQYFCKSVTVHYSDAIMSAMAFQITSLTIVYLIVSSGADQRKHQSSASLDFVQGIHRGPVNSPRKWPVTRKMFPLMTSSWTLPPQPLWWKLWEEGISALVVLCAKPIRSETSPHTEDHWRRTFWVFFSCAFISSRWNEMFCQLYEIPMLIYVYRSHTPIKRMN